MMVFRRERDVKITQTAAETNRLIIRVERVRGGEGGGGGGAEMVYLSSLCSCFECCRTPHLGPPRLGKVRLTHTWYYIIMMSLLRDGTISGVLETRQGRETMPVLWAWLQPAETKAPLPSVWQYHLQAMFPVHDPQ